MGRGDRCVLWNLTCLPEAVENSEREEPAHYFPQPPWKAASRGRFAPYHSHLENEDVFHSYHRTDDDEKKPPFSGKRS